MRRTIMLVAVCAFGMSGQARSLFLDLAKSGDGMKHAVSCLANSPETEEVRAHRLEPGVAKVFGLAVGDVIAFKLFSDKELAVTLAEETDSLTGRAFVGRIDNSLDAFGCVILETEEGIILDVTDFEHQRVWQVVSDAQGVVVREMKPRTNRCNGNDLIHALPGQPPVDVSVTTYNGVATVITNSVSETASPIRMARTVSSDAMAMTTMRQMSATSSGSGKTTVDILVNYDTDAADWARANGGGVTNFAETCVQKMNTALANTGLTAYFTFRLVGVYEVGGSAGGDLGYAVSFASGLSRGTLNGVSWDGVRAERDRVYADIVCTLCDNGSEYGTVGLGLGLKNGSDFAGCGFNACQIRSVANTHTMTHEVGHNMGAGHSDKMADADNCGPQYYDYSSGYYFYVGSTGFYTIMAYNSDGYGNWYTPVPYFSSPDHTFMGVAVGTAKNDNTRTLRLNYRMVADNRKPPFVSKEIGLGFETDDYVWTTDGSYPWTRVTDSSVDGVDSSRSCEMAGTSTSWTETCVEGPATLTFRLRLRTYGGWFNVLTDGNVSYTYGNSTTAFYGNTWESVSVAIPSGRHTVRLAYTHPGQGFTSGGNGAWVDQLAFVGGKPVDGEKKTTTTEVPVPFDWLAAYYPSVSTSEYETLAGQKGANGYRVWESYVAGLDPTDVKSVFKAVLVFENGVPIVKYEPVLSTEQTAARRYTIYGKKSLATGDWVIVPAGKERDYNFFKVRVQMR